MALGNQFAKHFGKSEVLVPHLNNYFALAEWPDDFEFHVHPNKEADDAFHPSSALMCHKALYAKMEGALPVEEHPMESQKNFLFGHFYHTVLQWIIVEGLGFATWDDIEKEYDLYFDTLEGNEYRVRGFIDIARCKIPGEGEYLVDIKTMMARVYSQPNPPEALMEKYRAQVQMYMEFENIDNAIILAAEKDSPHRFKEIVVERDGKYIDEILDGWELVVDSRMDGTIPDCTCYDPGKCPARNVYAIDHR